MEKLKVSEFGDWLRDELARRDRNMSWLARHLGVTPQTVADYIKGPSRPGRDKIPKLAAALELNEGVVWDAWLGTPMHPMTDATLARLLELPDDLRQDEAILMKHIFRAIRAAQEETEAAGLRDSGA